MFSKNVFCLFSCAVLFITACSDAPKQYIRDSSLLSEDGLNKIPTSDPLEIPEVPKEKTDGQIADENSKKPILYGIGAGGITFDSIFSNSKDKLSKPFYGPSPSDGLTAYHSGMYIWWRKTDPRTPQAILLNSNYLGEWELGAPFGNIKLGHDFSAFFTQEDPTGKNLLVNLYNNLEKVEDPNYSCLKEKICEIIPSAENLILSWPKLSLLFSKDRKTLFRMMLFNDVPQGKLNNPVDITKGVFELPNSDNIEFGQTWDEVYQIIRIQAKTSVSRNYFTKEYSGIVLGFKKSKFDRDYTEPDLTEKLNVVALYSGYKKPLMVSGKFVEILTDNDTVSLKLVSPEDVDPEKSYLNLKTSLPKKHHTIFMEKLSELLLQELKTQVSGEVAFKMLSGFHKNTDQKEYGASIVQFDPDTNTGKALIFELRESTGNIGFIELSLLDSPVDKIIVPTLNKPSVVQDKKMGGFALGQSISLSDIDKGRKEATATVQTKSNETLKVRASFEFNGYVTAVYEEGKRITERLQVVRLGSRSVSLGVLPDENGTFKIISISTSNNVAGTKGLCQLEDFVPLPGQKDTEVKKALDKAIAKAKTANPDFSCQYLLDEDPNATGVFTTLYFPKERAKLSFEDRELSSTTFYTRPGEVQ